MVDLRNSLLDRFIRYTTFDTMSDDKLVGERRPTTEGQEVMQKSLIKELEDLGLDVYYGKEKVVMGVLKANDKTDMTVGFMAHVDTANDVMGNGVKAQVWKNYDGKDIKLKGTSIDVLGNPALNRYIGSTIITSDGTTLLGSDDKAGVAIIMEAIKYLVDHPEVKHPNIEVYFTPDEETGSGMDMFPYDRIKSKVCYTVDGGEEGYVECECFNAATIKVNIKGVSYHLGSARGRMVNALTIASQIVTTLPQAESPEATDGRYGYYCPLEMKATGVDAELYIFIRDFDIENFKKRIENTEKLISAIASIYKGKAEINTHISYYNMAEANKKNPEAVKAIFESGEKLGFDITEALIRGGTDGARLAHQGKIPSPNIFTGGSNLHSLNEWVSLDAMNNSLNLVLEIIEYWNK